MKKKYVLPILMLLIAVVGIGWSTAFLSDEDQVVNSFSVGKVDIEVDEEDFTPPTNWDGTQYTKQVKINNLSEGPVLIRVAITPRWVDEAGNPFAGDIKLVTLNYATENITIDTNEKDHWILGSDGYWYYTTKMETQGNTELLLDSVQIDGTLTDMYKGKALKVDVEAEAIQATKSAYEAAWKGVPDNIKGMLDRLCQ